MGDPQRIAKKNNTPYSVNNKLKLGVLGDLGGEIYRLMQQSRGDPVYREIGV
jgi:hypothetical protein